MKSLYFDQNFIEICYMPYTCITEPQSVAFDLYASYQIQGLLVE